MTSAAQVEDHAAVAFAKPQKLIVDHTLPPAAMATLLKPVDAFSGFWNNGGRKQLD